MLKKRGIRQPFSTGEYNKSNDKEQWIRITQGCPHGCPFCYEPKEMVVFPIPKIVRNEVKIMDMNLLSHPEAIRIIKELGIQRVNGKVISYQLICGIDYRFLTSEIAEELKKARFSNLRIAWDWYYQDQFKIKKAIEKLKKVGYQSKDIQIFMICNWEIPFSECIKKLNLCKYWRVQVADCYFDGQVSPKIEPIGWRVEEIKTFRQEVRKHNQLVNFLVDPELAKYANQLSLT